MPSDGITPVRPSMPCSARPFRWDIFCNVIDNFGDIGVCWRLARQLATEHRMAVRLWVDDLRSFRRICPQIDITQARQHACGVEVGRWQGDLAGVAPGEVVVEAFACRLPERFEEAMAARRPRPVWINLDYLSAEEWVAECHGLPSPHPRLPLVKYFFFPGFGEATGGLLRENDLRERRRRFETSAGEQAEFRAMLHMAPLREGALVVSLFSYENPALPDLLAAWARGSAPVCCLAAPTRNQRLIEAFAGRELQTGDVVRAGQLELRVVPFVPQPDYDKLLWSCDINLVRGEDSFVRAQWAAKPMLWQIYWQDEQAHHVKLAAFLDLYCADLPQTAATAARRLFEAWNGYPGAERITDAWESWLAALPELRAHAIRWEKALSRHQDLCARLVQFCRSRL